ILENAYGIIGIEFIAAAQALDIRGFKTGRGVEVARNVVRKYVDFLDVDRPLNKDHNIMRKLIRSGEILDAVEKEIGSLDWDMIEE
ncbi:MAG: phenylalanine ammonia-lyase, partial [Bacteroidetes bacterium]|nr:phenylalanine ammonia-lyase [Bacteroidota bacterium]